MRALSSDLRRELEAAVLEGRHAAEVGVRAALSTLGVEDRDKPSHLSEEQAQLRRGLRVKQRQLGGDFDVLVWDAAYEQWHRLLFARFLAGNDLLRHPEFEAPVTLEECEELAEELGEPDGWSVAARFAAEILPGIFRLDDPCVRLRLAPEHRIALERIVEGLPVDVFVADDSLGWVYQYWQSERKDEVNASEDKVGGADLGPVTQLFTENYMVRFLLENSLGAWWAARHPDSPLVQGFEYLRFDDNGEPAAGTFEKWPEQVAEVTVMDPCCGSGHFLVEAFGMLWRMRAEEEGLNAVAAQDAVLQDNLFGLELDPRCVQIAMFAVVLTAWKQGEGWRELPAPNIACSGIPAKAPLEDWLELAGGDQRLRSALERLHALFKDADTLGSLIDPRRVAESSGQNGSQRSFADVAFEEIAPLLDAAAKEERADPAAGVLGADAAAMARAASLMTRDYTLLATNPPFLGRGSQEAVLKVFLEHMDRAAAADLATGFMVRASQMASSCGLVTPQSWLFMHRYESLRESALRTHRWRLIGQLGENAFVSDQAAGALVALVVFDSTKVGNDHQYYCLTAAGERTPREKAGELIAGETVVVNQGEALETPDHLMTVASRDVQLLGDKATSWQGLVTGDVNRYILKFWEVGDSGKIWERYVTAPSYSAPYSGRDSYLRWEQGKGSLVDLPNAHNFNPPDALGKPGVVVASMRNLRVALYCGEMFNDKSVPLIPFDEDLVPALWAYCSSEEFTSEVRRVNQQVNVGSGYFLKIPFDERHWRKIAEERYPGGLPEPHSQDSTQWLFDGRPEEATEPLQVGVARLLGYRWPKQTEPGALAGMMDEDGIVCLPAVAGELPAADRLHELLAAAFGTNWSPALLRRLIEETESKSGDLSVWLRDDFFRHHCKVFSNRPFIWHIWDGRTDGFSALVNYHRLNRTGLEKLTYTYLGDWIERQRADAAEEVAGADLRLAAAEELKEKLEAILKGEPPYDIFVRWKELHEQPIGWDPDLDDGVRLNVRPFVKAGVLRSKFRVHWKKDRGKNADGSERHNDLHFTIAEKQQARKEADGA